MRIFVRVEDDGSFSAARPEYGRTKLSPPSWADYEVDISRERWKRWQDNETLPAVEFDIARHLHDATRLTKQGCCDACKRIGPVVIARSELTARTGLHAPPTRVCAGELAAECVERAAARLT